MRMAADNSGTITVAEIIINLQHFMRGAPKDLGLNWAAWVILANLALPDISYLSSAEIIQRTGLNRCWTYRNLRMLCKRGLVDSIKQKGSGRQVRGLYTINGKGNFYLMQVLSPNGIRTIKVFEESN